MGRTVPDDRAGTSKERSKVRWRSSAAALFFLLLGPALAEGAPPAVDLPALLAKLGEQQAQSEQAEAKLDYSRHERDEELDSDHKPEHVVERWVQVTHPQGKEHEELVKETRDKEDVTAQTRPKFDEAQAEYREAKAHDPKRQDSYRAQSPFKPSEQAKYRFAVTSVDEKAGTARLEMLPRTENPDALTGEATVDLAHLQAVHVWLRPARLTRFTDKASVTLEYGEALGMPVLTRMETVSEGGLFFIKKRFHGVVEQANFARN